MKKHSLEFCFKGERDYVQGPDIYNQLANVFEGKIKNGKIDLSMHGIAKQNIDISPLKPKNEKLIKFVFNFIDEQGEKNRFFGIENDKKINCRYPYDEEKIFNLANLDTKEQSVSLDANTPYTFMENIVALNKYLLENLFLQKKGKWYFTKLQLKEFVNENTYPIKLVLQSNFNYKLTKTEAFVGTKLVGYIYFSLA